MLETEADDLESGEIAINKVKIIGKESICLSKKSLV